MDEIDGKGDLTEETLAVWQPRTTRRLAAEDAREAMHNVTGFFNLLRRWAADDAGKKPQDTQKHEQRE